MAWGQYNPEANGRRCFMEEARRRVLALLEDLHWFGHLHNRPPPSWAFERLAALAEQIGADDTTTSDLVDVLGAVEEEIRNSLAEMSAFFDADAPIPYRVTLEPIPAPTTLRPFLRVLRGGIA